MSNKPWANSGRFYPIYMTHITYLYIYIAIYYLISFQVGWAIHRFTCPSFDVTEDLTAQKKLSGCAGETLHLALSPRSSDSLPRNGHVTAHTLPDCFRQEDRAGLLVSAHTSYTSASHRSPVLRCAQIYPYFQVSFSAIGLICGFLDPFKTHSKLWTC